MMNPRGLLLAALLVTGCDTKPAVNWQEESGWRWRSLSVRGRPGGGFTRMDPGRTGVGFRNDLDQDKALDNRFLAHGSGVAIGDVDGNGLPDIYLASLEGPNALYLNRGEWRFDESAASAGVAAGDRRSTGVTLADVDGDTHLDLILTALGGPNTLFRGDGTGRFTAQGPDAGLESRRGSTTIALADVNGDGSLDLYVTNYKVATVRDLIPPQARAFDQVIRRRGDSFEVVAGFREHYRESGIDPLGRLVRTERADPDWFYLNDGTGRFRAVSFTSGRFRDERGRVYAEEPDDFGLAARFQDINGDGHPDLYVANDFSGPDYLWLNDGAGNFRAAPPLALRSTSHSSMAVDFSDIDRDGDTDFFVVDMLAPPESPRRHTQTPTNTPLPKSVGGLDDRPQMQRNTLFLNRGDSTFAQIADLAGVAASEWSWATMFLDVDLDGYEDILITTGHLWDMMDSDTHERLATTFPSVEWRRGLAEFPRLDVPNFAFRNRGDLTFEDASRRWGFGLEPDVSHGMAAGDLDGDGDLDVVINRLGNTAAVFRNDAAAPRVAVRLRGRAPNTQGIGARIRVRGPLLPVQEKEVTSGGLYLSGSDPLAAFATGRADTLTIEVTWRSGATTTVPAVRPNRLYEIQEPAAGEPESRIAHPESRTFPWGATPLFTDESATLAHRHVDSLYNDFARQPLLPNRLSQMGPGVAWYDTDGDGFEELLIGSGRGGSLAVYRNQRGRLVRAAPAAGQTRVDQTAILGLPDGRAGSTILVGQSSYEAASLAEALALPSAIRSGPAAGPAIPGDTSTAGALTLGDVDGDGTLDLFVAGRMLPAGYPLPASSRLFRNRAGRFEADTANNSLFANIGMVSAATFADLNSDGSPDLITALEWGPVRVFLNSRGRFRDATGELGLAALTSRWNGVTTGDLDGDGQLEIIATSWGRNTEYQASAERPLVLVYGDFDRSNTMDLIIAQLDQRLRGVAPLTTRARLLSAVPALGPQIPSFARFADATIDEVLGQIPHGSIQATTFDHTVFWNRAGRFEPAPLPLAAQIAPAFGVVVNDFDGDGTEDVFLSQNFFATELESPRYDAGRGLLLQGGRDGVLDPVPGQASGIAVYGEQRGAAAADYDHDGRVDLVVTQNGAATRLYRNRGARPGLRVRLAGPANNPFAVGAVVRVIYGAERGPARSVLAGSGYWSQDGATQVVGLAAEPTGLWIRWPGGVTEEVPLTSGRREVTRQMPR